MYLLIPILKENDAAQDADLHSIMYLLILVIVPTNVSSEMLFTFHNVSINSS